MKKYFKILIFIALALNATLSQAKNFLWKAESTSTKVYILGSIHLAKADIYPLNEAINKAFDESDNLVLEIDVRKVDQSKLQEKFTYHDGTTLKDNLPDSTFKKLQAMFRQYRIPESYYNKMKPAFAVINLVSLEWFKHGYLPQFGIDKHFLEKSAGKKVLELETIDFQLNLIEKIFSTNPEAAVNYLMDNIDKTVEIGEKLFKAWSSGNAGEIEQLMNQSNDSTEEYDLIMEEMLYKRNYKMTAQIENFLQTKDTYFIIVGSGHLTGERGIINLLKKKHYKLEQL